MVRLDDLEEASDSKELRLLIKSLKRYFDSINKKELGFKKGDNNGK